MDLATLFGSVIAFGAIALAYTLEGGNPDAIFLTAPILTVIGGTLGATTITTSMQTVLRLPAYLRIALFGRPHPVETTIDTIVKLSERARREGILGLEARLRTIPNPFFRKAVQLVIDGTEVTMLRDVLEGEILNGQQRHLHGIQFFQKAGGFAPTMGILGTVLGLVHALSNTGDASRMATSIAAAFVATLWGVGLANLFLLPISDKLRMRHKEEVAFQELIVEGVIALQSGDTPRNIRSRLMSFIAPKQRPADQ
ncbi:MAG: MotA/TolQ/ExbB proton channel family protein [bacterium]